MYGAVPRMTPASVPPTLVTVGDRERSGAELPAAPSKPFARPKSSTLTLPSGVTFTLPGLRSRWMTPAACAASSPSATWRPTSSASSTGNAPARVSSASVGPGTSSSTRKWTPSA